MTQMITPEEIRSIVLARKAYDVAIFKDSIIDAAEQEYIKAIIGKDLYAAIRTQYLADNLSAENLLLVNTYLKPILAYYVLILCLPTMMVDISSAGLQINQTEFSNPISSALRAEVAQGYRSIAQTYTEKAIEFIEDAQEADSTAYALYTSGDNVENTTSINGGIILDEE